jgi:hypothetical protein
MERCRSHDLEIYAAVNDRGWKREFEDQIPRPRGRQLVTPQNAANYIMSLPKAEQNVPEWQTAIACLIGAAEGRDFLVHARIGVPRALNRHVERVFNPDRKDPHWGLAQAGEGSIVKVAAMSALARIPDSSRTSREVRFGRVEDGRGSLGHSATLRFPSPLIEPDVPD